MICDAAEGVSEPCLRIDTVELGGFNQGIDDGRGFDVVSNTDNGRIQQLQITLSDWVFDAIENNHVLTLSPTYFQLRKPIERRLYELARKHCGKQTKWEIGLGV